MIGRSNSTPSFPFSRTLAKCCACVLVSISIFGTSSALAQEGDAAPKPAAPAASGGKGAPKKTSINFEDQLVEGQTQKPELFYLLQQRNNNFKRLIRLRENFLPEMRKTSEDVGRSNQGKGPN